MQTCLPLMSFLGSLVILSGHSLKSNSEHFWSTNESRINMLFLMRKTSSPSSLLKAPSSMKPREGWCVSPDLWEFRLGAKALGRIQSVQSNSQMQCPPCPVQTFHSECPVQLSYWEKGRKKIKPWEILKIESKVYAKCLVNTMSNVQIKLLILKSWILKEIKHKNRKRKIQTWKV